MKVFFDIPPGVRFLLARAVELVALLLVHQILLSFLAGKDVVAQILSGGPHTGFMVRLVMCLFLSVRVVVVLLLPGWVLMRLGLLVYESVAKGRALSSHRLS